MDNTDEGAPTSNLFHVTDVRLADLRANYVDDLEEAKNLFDEDDTGKWNVESKMSSVFEDENIAINDVYGSEERETLDEEGTVMLEAHQKKLSRFYRKFSIASDIEEVDEEMEEEEIFDDEWSKLSQILEPLAHEKEIRDTPMTRTKSKLVERTASRLEHRLKMIGSLKELFNDRKMIKMKNSYLNRKCCQFLEKSTAIGPFESVEGALPIHVHQRYQNVLEDFMVMQSQYEEVKPLFENESEKLSNSYEILSNIFNDVFGELVNRELEIGANFVDGETGKLLNGQKLRHLTKKQKEKFDQLSKVRVSYLKLNNNLSLINVKLRRLNDLGEGRNLMDYEQLMIVKHSLMDKMDERNEELRKFKEKCTDHVSILSHMKESSDILISNISNANSEFEEARRLKKKARALLVLEALKRDSLRNETSRIRHVGGLLENPMLLKKMNEDSRALAVLKQKVKKLLANDPISKNADNVPITREKISM